MNDIKQNAHTSGWGEPMRIGIVVGLIGGALIGLKESVDMLVALLRPPASPGSIEILALVSGLAFLSALMAVVTALGTTILGSFLALWQVTRRISIAPARLTVLFSTLVVVAYSMFLAVDKFNASFLANSGKHAILWGPILLGHVAVIGGSCWFIFSLIVQEWQRGHGLWLRPLHWSTARNLAGGLLAVLVILPLAFIALRRFGPPMVPGSDTVRAATVTASTKRPNIILITIDALRSDHLGAYGYKKARTPNIDEFAANGVLFEQANSQASWTFPSFASMFTSMYPSELDLSVDNRHIVEMFERSVDQGWITLAEAIQATGYRTQAIVTNPWLRAEFGFAQGFDGFTRVDDYQQYHISNLDGISLLNVARRMPPAYRAIEIAYTSVTGNPGEPLVWDVRADRVTDEATFWLRSDQATPFFLWVHYIDPHYPFDPPRGYRPMVEDVTTERLNYLSSENEEDIYAGRARLRPEDKRAIVELYDGEIAYTDFYVGRLLDEIDTLGLRDNTVVILTADHGDEFWEHDGFQHGHSLYDELIHVPLIIRGPDVFAQPRKISADVQHVDLMPTLLDLIGGHVPSQARGRSLLPLLRDQEPAETVYNFAEALFLTEEKKAIRGQGYKLIYAPLSDQLELYNLVEDPDEQNNLTGVDSQKVKFLYQRLSKWMSTNEVQAPGLYRSSKLDNPDPSTLCELVDDKSNNPC